MTSYEIKQDEVTPEQWEEMKKIVRENICAECEAELTIHTNPERGTTVVGCLNPDHHGYIERETFTQALRRGAIIHPSIQHAIEKKMMPKDDLGRAMQLLALRYPSAIVDAPTAALFIMDCARLDIDPLISPAEAVPVPFTSRKRDKAGKVIEEKTAITMIITEDGWLSMAARGCKDDWVGPPRTMRLEEYLAGLPENRKKTREEIQDIARDIKESQCKDKEAWYYVAVGKRRGGDDTVIPGYFTHPDHGKAETSKLPAASLPGNQARVRAIKRWVREVFPECRQRMLEITAEWYKRAEGIQAAQEYIDAEYKFISDIEVPTSRPKGDEKIGGAARKEKSGEGTPGTTILSPPEGKETQKSREAPAEPATEAIEGEGFHIDLTWLQESQKTLKWSEDTCKTFLVGKYKVSPEGTLTEMLARLTREQAEDFTREINGRLEKQAPLL